MVRPRRKRTILGVGLDSNDEIVRVTRGENYHLVGGSRHTHEDMQERCAKLNEKLRDRGKHLDELGRGELLELAAECDMKVVEPGSPQRPSAPPGRRASG